MGIRGRESDLRSVNTRGLTRSGEDDGVEPTVKEGEPKVPRRSSDLTQDGRIPEELTVEEVLREIIGTFHTRSGRSHTDAVRSHRRVIEKGGTGR